VDINQFNLLTEGKQRRWIRRNPEKAQEMRLCVSLHRLGERASVADRAKERAVARSRHNNHKPSAGEVRHKLLIRQRLFSCSLAGCFIALSQSIVDVHHFNRERRLA
jgi:hypothetical protein